MVISAFHLGRHHPPTPATTPVPLTQQALAEREPHNPGPGEWNTYPDELVAVLNASEELQHLGLNRWRVASHSASLEGLDALMKDIAAPLRTGLPAILNIKSADHWVVVSAVWLGPREEVRYLEYVDPAGAASPADGKHTYRDACDGAGRKYWGVQTPTGLASIDLAVGNTPPDHYRGQYVAIVHDPGPLEPLEPSPLDDTQDIELAVAVPSPLSAEVVAANLRRIAADMDLEDLRTLLDLHPHIRVWPVKDIGKSDDKYALALVSHAQHPKVVVCVCNAETLEVGQFTVSENLEASELLKGIADETLWWSRGPRPDLWQPDVPFKLETDATGARYRRLGTGESLSSELLATLP
jgi:hypothetical protein